MNRLDLYAGKIYDKPERIDLLLCYVLIMIVIRLVFRGKSCKFKIQFMTKLTRIL